jgi:hypothetical protein
MMGILNALFCPLLLAADHSSVCSDTFPSPPINRWLRFTETRLFFFFPRSFLLFKVIIN